MSTLSPVERETVEDILCALDSLPRESRARVLQAVAPESGELLELLQLAVQGCGKGDEVWLGHSWVKAAQDAIAKAQGGGK